VSNNVFHFVPSIS